MQVIVHGGAGRSTARETDADDGGGGGPDEPGPRQAALDDAAAAGADAATPLDAVEAALTVLESSPRFNAGVGGAVQSDGTVRTDAGIMASDRSAGAACSMPGVEHAVSVARVVLEETPHVLVAGEHAVRLAEAYGVGTGADLLTDRTRERWAEATRERWAETDAPADEDLREQLDWLRGRFGRGAEEPDGDAGGRDTRDHDTVGAVAREGDRLAAGTSTGGRWLALAGRVGDVPQIGGGFYCGPAGGASATGAGEDIARVTLSRRAVRHLEGGHDAQAAADRAVGEFAELTGATAGVIVLDRRGNVGRAFNSEGMQTATARR